MPVTKAAFLGDGVAVPHALALLEFDRPGCPGFDLMLENW